MSGARLAQVNGRDQDQHQHDGADEPSDQPAAAQSIQESAPAPRVGIGLRAPLLRFGHSFNPRVLKKHRAVRPDGVHAKRQLRSVLAARPLVLVSLFAPMLELPLVPVSLLRLVVLSLEPVEPVEPLVVELPVPLAPMLVLLPLVPFPAVLPVLLPLVPLPVVLLPAAEEPVLGMEPPVAAPAPGAELPVLPAAPEPLVPLVDWARARPPKARAAAAATVVRVFLVVDM
jgi:hypothetical protein